MLTPLTAIVLAASIVLALAYHFSFRRKLFAWAYSRYLGAAIVHDVKPYKKQLFAHLPSTSLKDPKGKLRILEIGLGPGANLQFFPANSSVIGVDPNPSFKQYFDEQLKTLPDDIHVEKVVCCSAENMTAHIPDDSIDVVIGTYVFCSIPDRTAALSEIKRVLVPGGKYFFLEHVLNDDSSFIATLQKILQPFWFYVMDGCHINRRFLPLVMNAGFSSVENVSKFVIDSKWFMVNPTDMGIAVK